MANTEFGKDKIKRVICLVLIFGGFAILHNFVPEGLDRLVGMVSWSCSLRYFSG